MKLPTEMGQEMCRGAGDRLDCYRGRYVVTGFRREVFECWFAARSSTSDLRTISTKICDE